LSDNRPRSIRASTSWGGVELCITLRQNSSSSADQRQGFSNCGPQRSAGGFGGKSIAKIVSDTEPMKNTPIHVCDKTAFIGSPSAKIGRISYFHNFLYFSHYFRKYFKLVHRKTVVMVTLTTGIMFLLFNCMPFCGEFYEGSPRVRRPPIKWSAIAEILRNT
jgi:hypothetical protein